MGWDGFAPTLVLVLDNSTGLDEAFSSLHSAGPNCLQM